MAFNPSTLQQALQARRLTYATLSRRLGMPATELNRELRREPEPKADLLRSVARELALPTFALYMGELPNLQDILPDFRHANPEPTPKDRETLEAIQFAEGIQNVLVNVGASTPIDLPRFTATTNEGIDEYALNIREALGISFEDQREAKDARAFYVIVRKKIEDTRITVLQESFPREDGSGFCLSHPVHPVILVNTNKQTRARRLFTLCHELAHVLMRQTGISDPFVRLNAIERRCNRFASSFLTPKDFINRLLGSDVSKEPNLDEIRWAARRLKISQEATVLRLEELGYYKSGTHTRWRELVHNNNPDFSEKGGGGKEPPAQEKVKLARYGFNFARALSDASAAGEISEINIYRASGLKPKYQRPYFDYVHELSSGELRDLDLDDG